MASTPSSQGARRESLIKVIIWERFIWNLPATMPEQSGLAVGNDRVGRVNNDLIVWLEAGDDLYLIAEIVSGSGSSSVR